MAKRDVIWVFLCNKETQDEVLRRGLVGTTRFDWRRDMKDIRKGARVVVYDYDEGIFIGPFECALVNDGSTLISIAFGGAYPAQAKIKWVGVQKRVKLRDALQVVSIDELFRPDGDKPLPRITGHVAEQFAGLFGFDSLEPSAGVSQQ